MHHLWIGAMLALYTMLPHWLQLALALVIVADDAVQHTWQALRNPAWASPLHRLYAWLLARGVR